MADYTRCHLCDCPIQDDAPWYGRNQWGIAICHCCTKSGTTEGLSKGQEVRFNEFMEQHGFVVLLKRNERGFAMLPVEVVAIVPASKP